MSRKFSQECCWFVIFVGLGLLTLTGCESFTGDMDYYDTRIAPEEIRQIDTLVLQETGDEEQVTEDVNEAPPKDLELTLEQCRAITLENNLALKVQLINPAIAAESVSQQEAQFESVFTSNLTYSKTDTTSAAEIFIHLSNRRFRRICIFGDNR